MMPSTVLVTRKGSTPMSHNRMNAPAASLVCSVLNTRWPVNDACMAFSAVSKSRISPTSTTSGIVAQDAAQARGKRQPHLGVHLDLIDALQLVFDRVLGRDDLGFLAADFAQRR